MSRIGKKPIVIPAGVKVTVNGQRVVVEGPKGKLEQALRPEVAIDVADGTVTVKRNDDGRIARGMHGLTRTLVANMVQGVHTPFKKSLEISGVGYRAELVGTAVRMQVGLSHEVLHPMPAGITCTVEKPTLVHIEGCDKALVGQVAAALRAYRPCEPYKGKGVKYVGERIRRKEGKTGAA